MKSKFKKLLATALVLCLVLALLPAAAFAEEPYTVTFADANGNPKESYTYGTVTAQLDPTNDADIINSSGSFDAGAKVLIKATPKDGCGLVSLVVGDDEPVTISDPALGASYSFTINADTVVKAAFRPFHAIADEDCGGGSVSTSKEQAMREDKVVVTAAPDPGYSVETVYYYENENSESKTTISAVNGVYSFEMPEADVTVGATFKENDKYTITVSPTAGGNVKVNPEGQVAAGTQVTVEARPLMGYEVTKIVYYPSNQGSIAPTDITTAKSFPMPEYAVTVVATFEEVETPTTDYYYIATADKITGGKIWSSANSAKAGDVVTIYVDPDWGWMTDDVYYMTTPDSGLIPSWQHLDHNYDTDYYEVWSFVMPACDVWVYADFSYYNDYGAYYIDTSYDSTLGGVEVWVNNNYVNNWHQGSWADYKDSVSFKVKPYYSDDVVSVSVVGKRTGWTYSYDYNSYSGWYTFTMPNEDVTINVDFRSGVHKVYVDKVTDGKLTVSDDWAKYGQIVYITAVPDYGCTLSSLSVRTATGDSVHVYNAQKADTYYFYMPDQYVSVSAVFTGKYTSVPFNDVSYGDWYYNAVQFVYSRGIMDGVDYYKFAPNGTITRGMILTMLWRMAGEPFEMPVTSFTDVEIGRYYTTAVAWACRNGIADGMGETKFGPNDAITREELVTLMYRYAQYFGHSCIGTSIEGFADAGSVSSYAYNAMCWAYKAGVVTGTTGSRLNPQGTASRAEAAQMIMSFYSFLNS